MLSNKHICKYINDFGFFSSPPLNHFHQFIIFCWCVKNLFAHNNWQKKDNEIDDDASIERQDDEENEIEEKEGEDNADAGTDGDGDKSGSQSSSSEEEPMGLVGLIANLSGVNMIFLSKIFSVFPFQA